MGYKIIYEESYSKNFKIEEQKILDELIHGIQESLNYNHIAGKLITTYNQTGEQNIIYSNNPLAILEKKFTSLQSKYSTNPILRILKNDIEPLYDAIDVNNLPTNYSYNLFIIDLGLLHAKNEVFRIFKNQNSLYSLMYELNDFKDFEIKDYRMAVDQTAVYRKLANIIDADPPNSQVYLIKDTDMINENADNLNEKEKAFLFYAMCHALNDKEMGTSNNLNLPFTELIRLNTIIDFKDQHCFKSSYRDSVYYKILSKGLEEIEKIERIDFLNTIIKKTLQLKLSKTTKYILNLRNKEVNKSIK